MSRHRQRSLCSTTDFQRQRGVRLIGSRKQLSDMRSFTAAVLVLALLAAPLACQASSQGRELKQDLSAITSLIGGNGISNIGGSGGSGFDISTITSALSGIAGSNGGGLTSLASNIGGGSGGLGNIVSSVGGRKMLNN
ncbi:g877 [Coccomyxa viridis]|uniref:G877 protein n=1 Tax=Coccomyxa viridis TaxID=1274662 RepID=A0ABP1FIT4_9CHLO